MASLGLAKTLALFGAVALVSQALVAAELSYWSPDASNPKRELKTATGIVTGWDYAGGVKLKDSTEKITTYPRDSVFSIRRDDKDWPRDLADAMAKRDVNALARIAGTARDDIDKEDALFAAADLRTGAAAATALREYIRAYPRGNFALDARTRLASILYSDPKAPATAIQEADRALEEAAGLGGEVAKARGNLMLGLSLLARKEVTAAADKLVAAADAAERVGHQEMQIQASVGAGEALAASNPAGAKARFEAALKVLMSAEFDPRAMREGRGRAHVGLATLAGNTKEGYSAWISASCWFIGQAKEGECLLNALRIAESLVESDVTLWEQRTQQLRDAMKKSFQNELAAYDRAKAGR